MAQGFFHWGVVTDPKSSRAMTNYALAQQIVKQDFDKAEKLYHMALTIDKDDRSAHTNLDELLLNRLPGGLYVSCCRVVKPLRCLTISLLCGWLW